MLATILDQANLRHGRVRESAGKFRHFFGGLACHDGVELPVLGRQAHLLYCFDLKDPRLGFSIPKLRWLPIYYAFRNNEGEFCYRISSDDTVEILGKPFDTEPDKDTQAFYKTFPQHFQKRKITIDFSDYDPQDRDELAQYGPVFGAGRLTEEEKLAVKSDIEENYPGMIFDLSGREPPYSTIEQLIATLGGGVLYPQGYPQRCCPNKKCKNHRKFGKLMFWLLIEPEEVDDEDLKPVYTAIAGADSGRLQVLICPLCHSICVNNVCT
jgi:hypothetical protein